MRILADENFPGPVIRALRERGYDVAAVKQIMRGSTDRAVLARAQAEGRIVVQGRFGVRHYRSTGS